MADASHVCTPHVRIYFLYRRGLTSFLDLDSHVCTPHVRIYFLYRRGLTSFLDLEGRVALLLWTYVGKQTGDRLEVSLGP